jgi:hypothetical protein
MDENTKKIIKEHIKKYSHDKCFEEFVIQYGNLLTDDLKNIKIVLALYNTHYIYSSLDLKYHPTTTNIFFKDIEDYDNSFVVRTQFKNYTETDHDDVYPCYALYNDHEPKHFVGTCYIRKYVGNEKDCSFKFD